MNRQNRNRRKFLMFGTKLNKLKISVFKQINNLMLFNSRREINYCRLLEKMKWKLLIKVRKCLNLIV